MGSSNPGRVKLSHGGVARNICEALAKGGVSVALVSYLDILILLSYHFIILIHLSYYLYPLCLLSLSTLFVTSIFILCYFIVCYAMLCIAFFFFNIILCHVMIFCVTLYYAMAMWRSAPSYLSIFILKMMKVKLLDVLAVQQNWQQLTWHKTWWSVFSTKFHNKMICFDRTII